MAKLKAAVAIEDSIDDLSQPPYPVIPANELCGNLLLELNRPSEAVTYFRKALLRTPNRPKAVFGMARAAEALGDNETAKKRYQEFVGIWRTADRDRPEMVAAGRFFAALPKSRSRTSPKAYSQQKTHDGSDHAGRENKARSNRLARSQEGT